MSGGLTLTLRASTVNGLVEIRELAARLAELPQIAAQTAERLIGDGRDLAEVVAVEPDDAAASGTRELRVRLQLTERARRLLGALRAGHVDLDSLERAWGHDGVSGQGSEPSPDSPVLGEGFVG